MGIFPRRTQGRPPHPDVLTPAEWRVLEELRRGRSNPEIARELGISLNTVKTHVSSMLGKLGLAHRHELAAWRGEPAAVRDARREGVRPGSAADAVRAHWRRLVLALGVTGAALGGVALLLLAMQGAGAVPPAPPIAPTATAQPEATRVVLARRAFTAAPSAAAARTAGTATELRDGRVLVAGGRQWVDREGDRLIEVAELFDPATGAFSPSASLLVPRSHHRATLLGDGRVLVSGGVGEGGVPLASTEVYDPATRRFSPGPEMAEHRAAHGAALLADGRVLVAGGVRAAPPGAVGTLEAVASAEVFDPASGGWEPAGDMVNARSGLALVSLLDGRALVAGGGPLELFDPQTNQFRALDLDTPGEHPTATLLADGRVLLVGGSDRGRFVPGPSHGSGPATRRAAIFDPASEQLVEAGEMVEERQDHAAVLLADGRILISGGAQDSHHDLPVLSTAEIYDPHTGTSSVTGSMLTPRWGHQLTLLADGTVLVTGAHRSDSLAAERYAP
jgi:DNA-binding CsgD family transcriptional regulator